MGWRRGGGSGGGFMRKTFVSGPGPGTVAAGVWCGGKRGVGASALRLI